MKPVRIIPVFRSGPAHAGYPDGYVVAPEDRIVREVEIEKPKARTKKGKRCRP